MAVLVMATLITLAVILPEGWGTADRVAMVLLGLVITGGLRLLARPRLDLTEERVTVVNSIRTHVLAWPEIIDVRMPVGEPWPSVDLADGSTLAVMGIQSSDGPLAQDNLDRFRQHLRERGEAAEPDRDR
ncbi:PH domain-containing protein [Actinorugispora endophytica]|nr:PH domain-containing protein [Actinorugispora endophytica]